VIVCGVERMGVADSLTILSSLLHNNTWPSEHMISPSAEFDPVIGGEVCPQACHKCVCVRTQRELLPALIAVDRKFQCSQKKGGLVLLLRFLRSIFALFWVFISAFLSH